MTKITAILKLFATSAAVANAFVNSPTGTSFTPGRSAFGHRCVKLVMGLMKKGILTVLSTQSEGAGTLICEYTNFPPFLLIKSFGEDVFMIIYLSFHVLLGYAESVILERKPSMEGHRIYSLACRFNFFFKHV